MEHVLEVFDTLHDSTGTMLASSEHAPNEVIGEVEIIVSSNKGKSILTRTIKKNDLLVNGAVFLSEKINGIRSTFRPTPVDVDLGVHQLDDVDTEHTSIPDEKVCGIMIGNLGAADTYNTVYKVNRAAKTVPGVLPFRVVHVDSDLSEIERNMYFLRVVKDEYAYYYGKKFDIDREINVQFTDGTSVPANVSTMADVGFIKTFTKYTATISADDVREYFKLTEGSTVNSFISSLGLVTGYAGETEDGYEEFFNVRTMTTLNTERNELKNSEAKITVIYRLYFQ